MEKLWPNTLQKKTRAISVVNEFKKGLLEVEAYTVLPEVIEHNNMIVFTASNGDNSEVLFFVRTTPTVEWPVKAINIEGESWQCHTPEVLKQAIISITHSDTVTNILYGMTECRCNDIPDTSICVK